MRELSIFVDESGDLGEYNFHAPYYIITLVFHDQGIGIEDNMQNLERDLHFLGWDKHCVHQARLLERKMNTRLVHCRNDKRFL